MNRQEDDNSLINRNSDASSPDEHAEASAGAGGGSSHKRKRRGDGSPSKLDKRRHTNIDCDIPIGGHDERLQSLGGSSSVAASLVSDPRESEALRRSVVGDDLNDALRRNPIAATHRMDLPHSLAAESVRERDGRQTQQLLLASLNSRADQADPFLSRQLLLQRLSQDLGNSPILPESRFLDNQMQRSYSSRYGDLAGYNDLFSGRNPDLLLPTDILTRQLFLLQQQQQLQHQQHYNLPQWSHSASLHGMSDIGSNAASSLGRQQLERAYLLAQQRSQADQVALLRHDQVASMPSGFGAASLGGSANASASLPRGDWGPDPPMFLGEAVQRRDHLRSRGSSFDLQYDVGEGKREESPPNIDMIWPLPAVLEPDRFPSRLPALLARPQDIDKLSAHQVLLRHQIEVFQATKDDIGTHTRGRNKPISLNQVGIRCRHCSHLAVANRTKGSTYFPASVGGLYQAAQNMSATHMQTGLCSEMVDSIKTKFVESIATKSSGSGAGRPYWADSAKKLGLVDTDLGIFFVRDMPQNANRIRDDP